MNKYEIFQEKLNETDNLEELLETEAFSKDANEKLKELLSEITDTRDEKYSFSWAGRSNSIKNIQTPSNGTLISDKEESINFDKVPDEEYLYI